MFACVDYDYPIGKPNQIYLFTQRSYQSKSKIIGTVHVYAIQRTLVHSSNIYKKPNLPYFDTKLNVPIKGITVPCTDVLNNNPYLA